MHDQTVIISMELNVFNQLRSRLHRIDFKRQITIIDWSRNDPGIPHLAEMRDGGIRRGERLRPADLEATWATLIEEPPHEELTPVARDDKELWDGDALLLRRLPEQLAGLPQRASNDAARPGDGDLCVSQSSARCVSILLRYIINYE